MKTYDVIVIGGGPAGMIAAGSAAARGKKVLLIEGNEKLGKKLFITGKGRCNITNSAEKEEFFSNITKNPKFFFSAFNFFSNNDLIEFLNNLGLKTKVERGGRIFPESDKSNDVIKALSKYLDQTGVSVLLNQKVKEITYIKLSSLDNHENRVNQIKHEALYSSVSGVCLESGEKIGATSVIICTGGVSYPTTGSTGDGFIFARETGHKIIDPEPSLIPLVTAGSLAQELQGLSLKNVETRVIINDKVVFSELGEMLFTHFGLSGPLILSSSFFIVPYLKKTKEIYIYIDLKPGLDIEMLDKRLLRDFEKNNNKKFKNSLDEILPSKLIPVIIKLSGINGEKTVNIITKEERKRLVELLKGLKLKIVGTRPISEAIITSGGVSIKDINPKTMESKIVSNLFFAGEVIDLDAYTGGFNLQIAFSTGRVAGNNA